MRLGGGGWSHTFGGEAYGMYGHPGFGAETRSGYKGVEDWVGGGRRFACANAHLNRDDAAVKMGHPGFGADREERSREWGKGSRRRWGRGEQRYSALRRMTTKTGDGEAVGWGQGVALGRSSSFW